MIRQDLLATGILILTVLFIALAISVTIAVVKVTQDICISFPELAQMIQFVSSALLLIMWLPITILTLYVLCLLFNKGRT